ncbi:MAG: hypothetical protein H5T96_09445 [Tissierellales bacterium]|nr:hypothetical protein [Tissierellales bacterium]
MKTIIIKITRSGNRNGPFNIYDDKGVLVSSGEQLDDLIAGKAFEVGDNVFNVTLTDTSKCATSVTKPVGIVYIHELTEDNYTLTHTACLWKHLTDVIKFNYYYGQVSPYILEYAFTSASGRDEILQSIKDYTTVYAYSQEGDYLFDRTNKVEVDDVYFNKAVVYNGQQSSGTLNLVPKPVHNLKNYMTYPILGTTGKTITFTKSDSFYNFNTYWDVVKDKTKPLFTMTCDSLSIDKIVNDSNMDYTSRSFTKSPLRAEYSKVRLIKDDSSDSHLVSNFIISTNAISYK